MWFNHISQNVPRPSDYDTLVANSHDTYSVIHWLAGDQVIRLDRTGIYQYYTDEDTDYFYEYYEYGGTNMCTCLRASKRPTGSDTDIYAHKMATYDFYGVFNGNLKDPRIYSWHGNDECPSYYWHGYGDGTVSMGWVISDDLPFLYEFSDLIMINDYPSIFWKIHENELPYQLSFPQLLYINDVPISMWMIYSGELPFMLLFPEMPNPPRMEKRYKGKHSKIIIPIYKQTIPVGKVLRSDPPG